MDPSEHSTFEFHGSIHPSIHPLNSSACVLICVQTAASTGAQQAENKKKIHKCTSSSMQQRWTRAKLVTLERDLHLAFRFVCVAKEFFGAIGHMIVVSMDPLNHLEERLLDQAHTRASYTLPFWGPFAEHTPRHDIGCPIPCKIIILPNKTIPQWIF